MFEYYFTELKNNEQSNGSLDRYFSLIKENEQK